MTNPITTINRERLEEMVKDDHAQYGDVAEMARALLAVMDAKPVAWRYRTTNIEGRPNLGWSFSDSASLIGLYQPLYTTPPAPSAPDGWIKCSDRMPDDDTLCLGCDFDGVMWTLHFDEGQLMPDIGELSSAITHWMPLPAAPGGEQ